MADYNSIEESNFKQATKPRKVGYDKVTQQAGFTLVGAFVIQTMLGVQYAWGNISPYVVGHFRDLGYTNITMNDFYSVLSVIMITSTLLFPIGQRLSANYGS